MKEEGTSSSTEKCLGQIVDGVMDYMIEVEEHLATLETTEVTEEGQEGMSVVGGGRDSMYTLWLLFTIHSAECGYKI